jgi:hypothetical protein
MQIRTNGKVLLNLHKKSLLKIKYDIRIIATKHIEDIERLLSTIDNNDALVESIYNKLEEFKRVFYD